MGGTSSAAQHVLSQTQREGGGQVTQGAREYSWMLLQQQAGRCAHFGLFGKKKKKSATL